MTPSIHRPGWEIASRIDDFATFSDTPDGPTRLYLGTAQRQAADVLAGWMRAAGMQARLDAVGNVVGCYEGEAPDAPALLLGSRIDTVRIRDPSDERRQQAVSDVTQRVHLIAQARGVDAAISRSHDAPAALCDRRLSDLLAASIARSRMTPFRLPSGAGHDAMSFRGRVPMAMLFVRCRGGISHHPAEYTSAEDIDVAARVLADFVDTLKPRHPEAAHVS